MDRATLQAKAEAQLVKQGLLPNKDRKALARISKRQVSSAYALRVVQVKRLAKAGHSQQFIADQLNISQQRVSQLLREWAEDTRQEGREILHAGAARMSLNLVKHGRPADHADALEGIDVIPQEVRADKALHIHLNGFLLPGIPMGGEARAEIVDMQPLSPALTQDMHSLSAEQAIAKGNIKPLISHEDSSPSAAISGAGLDGGPHPEGMG